MRYKEPMGQFKVNENSTIHVKSTVANFYLSNYNVDISKILYDLNLLNKHIGNLRGYLSTNASSYLNREGYLIMQNLDDLIIGWKKNNLLYYKALMNALSVRKKADNTFHVSSIKSIKNIKKNERFPF